MTQRNHNSLDNYLQEIGEKIEISQEEEQNLVTRIASGDAAAKERLITTHLHLVVSIARRFADKGVEITDLINEGNIGLIEAAGRFDASRGVRFASFASWAIRDAIQRIIASQGRAVSVPAKDVTKINKINKLRAIFEQENERRPNINEIAERADIAEPRVKHTMTASTRKMSVDAPVADGSSTSLLDKLQAIDEETADSHAALEALRNELKHSVTLLHHRERQVLSAFYGIDQPEMTFAEIGAKYGFSRERARQIRKKALRHLRALTKSKALRSYLS